MNNIPVARNKQTSYENLVAECPWCGKENIINRASDLGTLEPIAGLDVSCQSDDCGKKFRIIGDSVNNPHEMLIFDCYELLERKHYMNCILSLSQAYEVFFSLFFRIELLYKPFAAAPDQDLTYLNQLSESLNMKIKDLTFAPMRALFLQHVITDRSPNNLAEASAVIAKIPYKPKDPKDRNIQKLSDGKLVLIRTLISRHKCIFSPWMPEKRFDLLRAALK